MFRFKQRLSALTAAIILIGLCAWTLIATSASAAVVPNTSYAKSGQYQLKTDISSLLGHDEAILDWRSPVTEIRFDIPQGDWSDGLTLKLSGTPQSSVSKKTPLMVTLNNGTPVPVRANGHRFDADIKLSTQGIRPTNNIIKIEYKTPSGADCLSPSHGGWALDFARSELVLKARHRTLDFTIGEVEGRLTNSMSALKTVAILAHGQDKTALEALIAQGLGIRMANTPDFILSPSSKSDLTLHVGTRAALRGKISDEAIMNSSKPMIAVKSGRPLSLVITANEAQDVLALAQQFSIHHLPNARRKTVGLNEMEMQIPLFMEDKKVEGTHALHDLGDTYFETNYRPNPVSINFSVTDTHGASGQLLLSLSKNKSVADTSRVDVSLNGQALGYTKIDKASKRVAFDVPAGALNASGNELVITPVLDAAQPGCDARGYEPGITLGTRSKLTINTPRNALSLSRLASSGAPFALRAGDQTVVVLSPNLRERAAGLSILAKLAQASGTGWPHALFTTQPDAAVASGRDILVIGSRSILSPGMLKSAPRALTDALNGIVNPNLVAQTIRFASASSDQTFAQYASLTQSQRTSLKQGGIAAVYNTGATNGKVIGVITANTGSQFINAARQISHTNRWDALSGSVTRWDSRRVVLAQAHDANAVIDPARLAPASSGNAIANFTGSAKDGLLSAVASTKDWFANLSFGSSDTTSAKTSTEKVAPALTAVPSLKPKALSRDTSSNVATVQTAALTQVPALRGSAPLSAPLITDAKQQSRRSPLIDFRNIDVDGLMITTRAKLNQTRIWFSRQVGALMGNTVTAPKENSATDRVLGNHFLMISLLITAIILGLVGMASPSSASKD